MEIKHSHDLDDFMFRLAASEKAEVVTKCDHLGFQP